MKYTAIFEKMDNGGYFAQCEQMPNAVTQGKTIAEAKENLQAPQGYLTHKQFVEQCDVEIDKLCKQYGILQ
jgi:predicted RNase H-like HicB family nuclease